MENVDDDPDDNAYLVWGEHNIDEDPQFSDDGHWDGDSWIEGDYHLISGSPCIDVGDNSVVNVGDVDLDGESRILDGDANGSAIVDMGADELAETCPGIVSSLPPDGAIDARQPFEPDGSMPQGWQEILVSFQELETLPVPSDFTITQEGGKGQAPGVTKVAIAGENQIQVILSHAIEVGAWTTLTHNCSGTSVRLGYLPGDVNGDAITTPNDILALVDALNHVVGPTPEEWSTDIDRDGKTDQADVQRLIELLKGEGSYPPYNGMALP